MSCEFYRHKMTKARKQHKCDLCRSVIEKDEIYNYEFGKFEGEIFENHLCESCNEFQDAFMNININDLDEGYNFDDVITDINEIACYECRQMNGNDYCEFSYHGVAKCDKAKELYLKAVPHTEVN